MSLKNSLQIMVVDDMSVSRGLIENALDEIGLRRVDFKTDGQSALRSLVGNPGASGHFRLQHARYGWLDCSRPCDGTNPPRGSVSS
jgi:CheY-like chemotaxis protein